jgi:hypothetical protein
VTREHARRKRCAALLEEECEVGDDRAGEREQDADLDGSVLHREDAGTTGAKRPLPLSLIDRPVPALDLPLAGAGIVRGCLYSVACSRS